MRDRQRRPDEPSAQSVPDAVAVVPATFNMIDMWAAGINDRLALCVLNGALGTRLAVVASPYAKADLAAHPRIRRPPPAARRTRCPADSNEALRPADPDGPFQWSPVLDLLRALPRPAD
ncbi:hypothetical protein GCM10010123_01600 [Pilimelia anulata]|uniref:Flavoprotein domain-containing protein n=1 Tax=Pilimelia anulata TaxID=53371 RepID=A0A8J3B2D9_9ACTN|nr:hypothetical protein GCM10010123_01600 [Pilimelia anulata]